MATRLYVTPRTPGSLLFGAPHGNWSAGDSDRDNRAPSMVTLLLAQSKTDGGVANTNPLNNFGAQRTAVANQKLISFRWVTDPLGANVTITGTLLFTVRVSIPNVSLGESGFGHMYAYVSVGDSLIERAVLVNNVTDVTAWNSTITWRTMTFAITNANALAGDRIVVEFGANVSPGSNISNVYNVQYGCTNTSNVPYADATDGSTGTGAAWAEFSTNLTFAAAPAPPANDACVDAIVVPAVPYTAPVVDSTTSADTDRQVWWTWVADRTGRMFVSTWGGNGSMILRVYTGNCGALNFVIGSLATSSSWQGTAQAVTTFNAVAGTQYWFQVGSYYLTVGPLIHFTAIRSGSAVQFGLFPALSPPQTDDLYVDCQHIVAYRNGLAFNCTPNFYQLTPTGNAIDYTLRSLDDLNGGVNTNQRLYVMLFGSGPLVEILDLDTLDVDTAEVDYILDPLNFAGHGQNGSTVVFDASGNIVLGFYGDHYTVIGSLSSPAACAVRKIDGTHADNQAGAPWPEAAKYTIVQDVGGSDFVELATDQHTIWYTSAGTLILKYDLTTSSALGTFATLPALGNVRPGARGVRLLPPGDGSGGLLVAYGSVVYRLDSSGAIVATYTPSPSSAAQDLDKVEITADATKFWVSDQLTARLFQFDMLTGLQTAMIVTGLPEGQLCGFSIYLGYRAGLNPPGVLPPTINGGNPVPIPLPGGNWVTFLQGGNPTLPGGCPAEMTTPATGLPGCVDSLTSLIT